MESSSPPLQRSPPVRRPWWGQRDARERPSSALWVAAGRARCRDPAYSGRRPGRRSTDTSAPSPARIRAREPPSPPGMPPAPAISSHLQYIGPRLRPGNSALGHRAGVGGCPPWTTLSRIPPGLSGPPRDDGLRLRSHAEDTGSREGTPRPPPSELEQNPSRPHLGSPLTTGIPTYHAGGGWGRGQPPRTRVFCVGTKPQTVFLVAGSRGQAECDSAWSAEAAPRPHPPNCRQMLGAVQDTQPAPADRGSRRFGKRPSRRPQPPYCARAEPGGRAGKGLRAPIAPETTRGKRSD